MSDTGAVSSIRWQQLAMVTSVWSAVLYRQYSARVYQHYDNGYRETDCGTTDQNNLGPRGGHDDPSGYDTAGLEPLRPPATEPKNEQCQEHRGERQQCPSNFEWPVRSEKNERTTDKEAECASFPRQLGSLRL
jgi:hypothetical protein